MTEKYKKFFDLLESVTPEVFTDYLDAKKVSPICPMCKHGVQIIPETVKSTLADLNKRTAFVTFYKHTPVQHTDHDANYYYQVHCENCGFVSMYTATMVLDWLTQRNKDNEAAKNEE
ncbi:Uncharacterised protein [Serratia quinivorans]|jgi:hypothetical protein|uniref:hypothetical protein n=1 Tax=Serratia quinivorans TaxID=137545 RepID=UPI000DA03292|nr:hypothetical protein [Serratia quinivorans]SPZ59318.1 Uncharacterised protein [Serratia quinivorans]VEI67989.1 Uncharacterised protein [Serratia quinivorans]